MNHNAAITNAKRFLCVKKLTCSDGFTCKTVKVPRAEARFFIGELRNRQVTQLVLLDEAGNVWELLCQCIGGQYALSRIGAFCEAHGVRPGAYFIFYADHDHVVRLAVRQELPEDVQAAIAAARAVMAVRNSPQRPPAAQPEEGSRQAQQQQQQAAELPATVPVLEDATGLEEMPADEPVLADSAPEPAVVVVPAEPDTPRAMPLQDRSNTPDRQSGGLDSSNQPKPLADGAKPGTAKHSSPSSRSAPTAPQASNDKENEPSAVAVTGHGGNMKAPAAIEATGCAGESTSSNAHADAL
ncbi:hypothetical protein HYH02_013328 [Chlamydomonas schloesseri]|uniref:TF-B3 domain-containing protein n=1 Tax=Chlamydomonas schloesseri TaxID=2026947 RepID=A0A835VZ81_9CHLO|nr:hypothetical protein HYH02_013328 [Chlamydomonas schloesseri]|eukprot:KAG2431338.1 hypothetical protein HYH02_013328 [Chlamydomonas schloesseri]